VEKGEEATDHPTPGHGISEGGCMGSEGGSGADAVQRQVFDSSVGGAFESDEFVWEVERTDEK